MPDESERYNNEITLFYAIDILYCCEKHMAYRVHH